MDERKIGVDDRQLLGFATITILVLNDCLKVWEKKATSEAGLSQEDIDLMDRINRFFLENKNEIRSAAGL